MISTYKETHGVRNIVFRFTKMSDSHFLHRRLFPQKIVAFSSIFFHQAILFHHANNKTVYKNTETRRRRRQATANDDDARSLRVEDAANKKIRLKISKPGPVTPIPVQQRCQKDDDDTRTIVAMAVKPTLMEA
jgi:hypothetical protein